MDVRSAMDRLMVVTGPHRSRADVPILMNIGLRRRSRKTMAMKKNGPSFSSMHMWHALILILIAGIMCAAYVKKVKSVV